MADIVLTTLNAKHLHAAFGLRYLLANLGPLRAAAAIAEFDINQRPLDIAEALLARRPKVIGLGVYIWNVAPATEVVATLKRLRPDLTVILGGPEVSYEPSLSLSRNWPTTSSLGEADLAFAELCRQLLSGQRPAARIIPASPPEFSELALPYDLYDNHDVAHASSMWKPHAVALSPASSACPPSTSRCGKRHCPRCLIISSACWTGACGSSSSWTAPSISTSTPAAPSSNSCSNATAPGTSSILNLSRITCRMLARGHRAVPARRAPVRDWRGRPSTRKSRRESSAARTTGGSKTTSVSCASGPECTCTPI